MKENDSGEMDSGRQDEDTLCGCGYRQSLHKVEASDGGVYCQLAAARWTVASLVARLEGYRDALRHATGYAEPRQPPSAAGGREP